MEWSSGQLVNDLGIALVDGDDQVEADDESTVEALCDASANSAVSVVGRLAAELPDADLNIAPDASEHAGLLHDHREQEAHSDRRHQQRKEDAVCVGALLLGRRRGSLMAGVGEKQRDQQDSAADKPSPHGQLSLQPNRDRC
ncbi:hypothetical protein [Lentzea albidocapillata]|uniref:hypothetical protein n=1 Tax=Lentzea albidocapillata TaxID=40571 RepID=UPI00115F8182|nr:hypothetical protein [Lentzea albidocapillata]